MKGAINDDDFPCPDEERQAGSTYMERKTGRRSVLGHLWPLINSLFSLATVRRGQTTRRPLFSRPSELIPTLPYLTEDIEIARLCCMLSYPFSFLLFCFTSWIIITYTYNYFFYLPTYLTSVSCSHPIPSQSKQPTYFFFLGSFSLFSFPFLFYFYFNLFFSSLRSF